MFRSVSPRSGRLLPHGRGVATFEPTPLPPPDLSLSPQQWRQVTQAERALGELRGALTATDWPRGLVGLAALHEAVASSRLDGQPLRLADALLWQLDHRHRGVNLNAAALRLTNNHAAALTEDSGSTPTSLDLTTLHRRLYQDLQGRVAAGSVRDALIWIGPRGSTATDAPYVPPAPANLSRHMDSLQRFIEAAPQWPAIVHGALCYYQIDTLHPFLDGSGRMARLALIRLLSSEQTHASATLVRPTSLWSHDSVGHFQQLQRLREHGDYETWICDFAGSMLTGAQEAIKLVGQVNSWLSSTLELVREQAFTQRRGAADLLAGMVAHPLIDVRTAAALTGRNFANANILVQRLAGLGVLQEVTGQRRNRRYSAGQLLDIIANIEKR